MALSGFGERDRDWRLDIRLRGISLTLILMIAAVGAVGVAALYSAAGGEMSPWAERHLVRLVAGMAGMILIAMIDIRYWFHLAYIAYWFGILVLFAVEIGGHIGMGAQRWLTIGPLQIQPSEFMKIAIILALARYYHSLAAEQVVRLWRLVFPVALVGLPVLLVLRQPDLGTSLMLGMVAVAMMFYAGVRLWLFWAGTGLAAAAIPIVWTMLHDYQRQRVLTFLNPESDPLGAGYHITQSKIALGSGGISGKGFLNGTQSHLNFLPEKQTDFIFTLWAEEWGLLGGLGILTLFLLLIAYGYYLGFRCSSIFGRLLALGLSTNLFLYVAVNVAMVTGLIPVVGAPLPLVSYGGTALLAVMTGFGLLMAVSINRDTPMPRKQGALPGFD